MAGLIEVVIFGGLAYWLFRERAKAVVNLISTKLYELYNGWETQGKILQNKDKTFKKEKSSSDKFNNKTELRKSTGTGFDCASCSPSNRGSLIRDVYNTSSINILNVQHLKSHPKGFLSKMMPQLCQALSFKKHHFSYIYESVLKDERIQEVYEAEARQSLEDSEILSDPLVLNEMIKKQKQRAAKIVKTLRSTFSDVVLRLSSFVMTKVMSHIFSSVIVNPAQINMLYKAESTNLPLIFLPLHRSHLDYIVITFILANNNIKSPLVAAGENLRIPIFGSLLRGLGAFFIKRRMDSVNGKKDILYRALLHTYMIHSLTTGHNFEFFIEGGRTRSGKPCMPKGGLLSVFLDAYMDGTIEDALLVPVSINYERIVDGNFIREQMGQPKQIETFRSAISAIWKVITFHYGMMRVDFNQPFSLKELVNTFESKISPTQSQQGKKKVLHTVPSTASLFGTDEVLEEHRQLVDSIGRHVIYDCCCSTAAMSTNAVSFLLLNAYRQGVELETLAKALDELRDELFVANKSLGFSGPSVDVIKHAIKILGSSLVNCEINSESGKEIVTPITTLPNIIELSYYGSTLIPHFVMEAVIIRSINSLLKTSGSRQVSHTELIETCNKLFDIMQYEFIFTKTCQSLDLAILSTIETLIEKNVLFRSQVTFNEDLCGEEINQDKTTQNKELHKVQYMTNPEHSHLSLFNAILQPLLDVYTVTSLQMHKLLSRNMTEKELVQDILKIIETQLENDKLKCGESMSVDIIKNSLKLLEKWDVLECLNKHKVKTYALEDRYDDEQSLKDITERIGWFTNN